MRTVCFFAIALALGTTASASDLDEVCGIAIGQAEQRAELAQLVEARTTSLTVQASMTSTQHFGHPASNAYSQAAVSLESALKPMAEASLRSTTIALARLAEICD
jgi:hypothetical protein